jgi:hypothetical protein
MNEASSVMEREWHNDCPADTEAIKMKYARVNVQSEDSECIRVGTPFSIELDMEANFAKPENINFSFNLYDLFGQIIFNSLSESFTHYRGNLEAEVFIPADLLNTGIYKFSIMVAAERTKTLFYLEDVLTFEVFDTRDIDEKWFGDLSVVLIRPRLRWKISNG